MNVPRIRQDFPFFQCPSPVTYLDNAATTHKPEVVIGTMARFYRTEYATVHRALYPGGEGATSRYEQARDTVARFINAAHREEIIFTKGTTEGLNVVASTWAMANLKAGDEIVITIAEHHANFLPWQRVAHATGSRLVVIPVDHKTFTLINPCDTITAKTKLVAITHDSNVLGPLWNTQTNELQKFIAKARNVGAIIVLDCAQSVMHQKLDVHVLGVDCLAFSGHKMYGPTGIGVLYMKKNISQHCEPYQLGGSMVNEVTVNHATWAPAPHRFEAGTPPIVQAIGLEAAITYITQNINYQELNRHEAMLCRMLIDGLKTIPGLVIVGNQERITRDGHLVSFAIKDMHAHDLAAHLGSNGYAVRAGHQCAQPLVTALGFESLLRASVTAYTTQTDVELFVQQIGKSVAWLTKVML